MAGLWIPWECGLERKAEVLRIAKRMDVDPCIAAVKCMVVWCWAQDQTVDGIIRGISVSDVSQAVGMPGIGEALESVDWLISDDDFVVFPNWGRFNSEPAKKRAINAHRMRVDRAEARVRFLEEKEAKLKARAKGVQ